MYIYIYMYTHTYIYIYIYIYIYVLRHLPPDAQELLRGHGGEGVAPEPALLVNNTHV